MTYTKNDVFEFINEEGVKFIRLTFCDLYGRQKNVSIMPEELERAFTEGISMDASAIPGYAEVTSSDLRLFPIPSTLNVLPWRPSQGKVIRMFCEIRNNAGEPFETDPRYVLSQAVQAAKAQNIKVEFGPEFEFYLFKTDENGNPTKTPLDNAGYMDLAPDDKGENVRREICLMMTDMGIQPVCSHHEAGPGQNEIDFRASGALSAADNCMNFIAATRVAAARNGLYADFTPRPLENTYGSGMHLHVIPKSLNGSNITDSFLAGVIEHIAEITYFLNPHPASYARLGTRKAPRYISWSAQNRNQLIRILHADKENRYFELRSPDPTANPYIAFAMIIYAGLDGVSRNLPLPAPTDVDLSRMGVEADGLKALPSNLDEARRTAMNSEFVHRLLPDGYIE